jgi:hypothetical protein
VCIAIIIERFFLKLSSYYYVVYIQTLTFLSSRALAILIVGFLIDLAPPNKCGLLTIVLGLRLIRRSIVDSLASLLCLVADLLLFESSPVCVPLIGYDLRRLLLTFAASH